MYQPTRYGYRRLSVSEDIFWTKPRHMGQKDRPTDGHTESNGNASYLINFQFEREKERETRREREGERERETSDFSLKSKTGSPLIACAPRLEKLTLHPGCHLPHRTEQSDAGTLPTTETNPHMYL